MRKPQLIFLIVPWAVTCNGINSANRETSMNTSDYLSLMYNQSKIILEMKKNLIISTLMFISLACFSQGKEKRIEISNGILKSKLEAYILYIKDWANRADVADYTIALEQQKKGGNSVFTLSTFLSSRSIDTFRPVAYTVINNCPVMINCGFKKYGKLDKDLVKFLKETYWKGTSDISVPLSEDEILMKEFNESVRNSTDSVTLISGKGKVERVPTSGMRMHIVTNAPRVPSKPKSWTLYFEGQFLKRETECYQPRSQ